MGGFGSGRMAGFGRDKTEACRCLDVNRLKHAGYVGTHQAGNWEWWRGSEKIAWIGVKGEGDRIKLTYRSRTPGADWVDVIEYIEIARVACYLGGFRAYFICPGIVDGHPCRRRAVKLYGPGRYFLCRHCYRLAYSSQYETPIDRMIRRADKLRMTMGGEPGLEQPLPRRPKGMWRRTYKRRLDAIVAADEEAEAVFVIESERLLSRIIGE